MQATNIKINLTALYNITKKRTLKSINGTSTMYTNDITETNQQQQKISYPSYNVQLNICCSRHTGSYYGKAATKRDVLSGAFKDDKDDEWCLNNQFLSLSRPRKKKKKKRKA